MYRTAFIMMLLIWLPYNCMGKNTATAGELQKRCERKIDPNWLGYCPQIAGISYQHARGKFLQLPSDAAYTLAVTNDIQEESLINQLIQYQSQRLDKQSGSNTNTGASTSLVSKPGIPDLLAFATEAGALTQSNNGASTTFQGNVGSIIALLGGISPVCIRLVSCNPVPVLGDIAVSATASIAQGGSSTTPIAESGNTSLPAGTAVSTPSSSTRLGSLSVRYQISNKFDPHSGTFRDKFTQTVKSDPRLQTARQALSDSFSQISSLKATHDQLATLATKYQKESGACMDEASDEAALECLVPVGESFGREYVDVLRTNNPDSFDKAVTAYYGAMRQLQSIRDAAYAEAKGTPMFTVDYVFNRPLQQPETHDFRLVFGKAMGTGLLSMNAAGSVYGGRIPTGSGVGRFKDAQVSGQFDRPLSKTSRSASTVLSLAGYYQYQSKPSVLNITSSNLVPGTNITLPQDAQVLLGPSGSVWVTQAKLTIKLKNGAEIPIAAKWSNKPDFLSGNRWGGQFGLTYDLSAFKQLLGQ